MIMAFKYSCRYKILFYTVFICSMCVKYKYASRTVCGYANDFRKSPGCALIGACVLIRMNMVNTCNVMITVYEIISVMEKNSDRNIFMIVLTKGCAGQTGKWLHHRQATSSVSARTKRAHKIN